MDNDQQDTKTGPENAEIDVTNEEIDVSHAEMLHYGFAKCFDAVQNLIIKRKISNINFSFNTVGESEESLADCLDETLGFFLLFVNELCKEEISLCKLLLEMETMTKLDDNSYKIIENKITFELPAAYKGLKFLMNSTCNNTIYVPQMLLNNTWNLLSKYCPLHEAACDIDEKMINWLLDRKINVSLKDFSGNTALHRAVEKSDLNIIKLLCEADISLNDKNNNSFTALHLAVTKKNVEIVQYLLEKNCDISTEINNGDTPLHSAVCDNSFEIVKLLLNKSEDLSIAKVMNNNGFTPIHMCIEAGYWRILEVFISKNCDMNVVTSNCDTPLHLAVKHVSNEGVTQLLNCNIKCTEKNADGLTPMHISAQKGHINNIEIMVRHDPEIIDIESNDGSSPLHYAALFGHKECCNMLMKLGAFKEKKNNNEESILDKMSENGTSAMLDFIIETFDMNEEMLLFQACKNGHLETVHLLIERQCANEEVATEEAPEDIVSRKRDISGNIKTNSGITPFHIAAQFGHIKILEELIHAGRSWINTKSYDGVTPLMRATLSQNFKCVKFLLENNAEVNIKSSNGMTAFHYAVACDNDEIVKLLIENGADLNARCCGNWTPLHKAVLAGNQPILRVLFSCKGLDLNAKDSSGFTALHLAVLERKLPIIKLILESGADSDVRSQLGDSPLMLATKLDFYDAVELFIDSGFDLDTFDIRHSTPLHLACRKGVRNIIEKLLSKGASYNNMDIYYRTPFDLIAGDPELQDIFSKFSK